MTIETPMPPHANRRDNDFWGRFWSDYITDVADKDEQSQVLRTRNKVPVDQGTWAFTLDVVAAQLELAPDDTVLDLCCGNGLFAAAYCHAVARIEAVDISARLVERLNARGLPNVHAQAMDMRNADFAPQAFSKVLWYAGIQYIDESDIVQMMRRIRRWMKPGGVLLIGDIPDRRKLWEYFNDPQRQAAYFNGLEKGQPMIGTWLDPQWITNLCHAAGFSQARAVDQPSGLIYADFRFDLLARA